jgi:hypothetical protein
VSGFEVWDFQYSQMQGSMRYQLGSVCRRPADVLYRSIAVLEKPAVSTIIDTSLQSRYDQFADICTGDLGDVNAPSEPPCSRCRREQRNCVFLPSVRRTNQAIPIASSSSRAAPLND